MPKPRSILCPLDFSDHSMEAFRYAEDLAGTTGAELVVAHAFDRPATLDLVGQTNPADKSVREKLDGVQSALPLKRLLHAGVPGEVICWLAQENDCDLIVMSTHGRSGLLHALFGSVTEYVIRHARCPVLTLRHQEADHPKLSEPLVLPLPAPRLM